MSQLKAILNKATGMYDIPYKEYSTVLKGKRQENTAIYLRPTELNKIQRTKVISDTERYAKALFLIQAWTGARYSDAKDFDSQNIQGEQLDYVTQKTGTRVSVPLKPIVREMIKEKETLDPISITSYEGIIKAIAYKARLRDQVKVFKKGKYLKGYKYEFVTGHTARRSFATNLMMSGVDVFTISKLMGHSSPIMTQKYICEVMDNDKLKKILS
jgi:integrase